MWYDTEKKNNKSGKKRWVTGKHIIEKHPLIIIAFKSLFLLNQNIRGVFDY